MGVGSFAKQLVDRLKTRTDGLIVNVWTLTVSPGTILGRSHGTLFVKDTLSARMLRNGDSAGARTVADAALRCRPGPDREGSARIKLKYRSDGVTLRKASAGTKLEIPADGATVAVDASLEFSGESEYVFDTSDPVPWFAFDPEHVAVVRDAALRELEPGELVVTGAAWATRWVWYVCRSKKGGIGFDLGADAGRGGLGWDQLANARAGLQVRWSSGEILDGGGESSVPAFTCQIKRDRWIRDDDLVPFDTSTPPAPDAPALVDAGADDLFEGGGL